RASRSWLLERYEKRYNRSELIWSINAGLPVDNAGNEKLSVLYQQLLHTAWVISVLPGPISLSRVRQYMKADVSAFDAFPAVYRSKIISKQAINTFPACCAQICGYVHSKQCGDDLHMLIDIGAGTISIATFMVERNDADTNKSQCTLYSCAVEPIGVSYLLKRRHENLKLTDGEINLFKDIPDASVFSQAHDLTEKDIKFADTLYSGDAAKLINKVLDHTKNQHCPDSSYWESGVPTFIYGGGAHMEIVQNIIHSHENKSPPHKIRSIRLNPPEDLMVERLPEDSYDRLSVAYGLAFKVTEIDQAGTEKAVSNIGTASEA
ncbi:MAG: hypothetical protein KAT12_08545, partial [Gammaproteobacteria bacterium]|nr:hypothetical protein [Gammaproteobacteria bacterium]